MKNVPVFAKVVSAASSDSFLVFVDFNFFPGKYCLFASLHYGQQCCLEIVISL